MSRFILISGYIIASLATFFAWAWHGRPQHVVDAPGGRIACMSYSPHVHGYSPFDKKVMVPAEVMQRDLEHLKTYTDCIRTYATGQGQDAIPKIAAKLGMKVLMGIWISRDEKDNEEEIARGIAAAKAHPQAIRAIIVGNEVMLRGEQTDKALALKAQRVKAATGLPVTIADIWAFWLKHPDLAASVDFITIHILPYWEDDPQPITRLQPLLDDIVGRVNAVFPHTKFLIGETGWPSMGRTRGWSVPSLINQARFIREFVALAAARGWDYNLIEAYDQPWKRHLEGTVGGAWGLLSPDGSPKFPFTGPVSTNPNWMRDAFASLALGGLGLLAFLIRPPRRLMAAARTGVLLPLLASIAIMGGEFVIAASVRPAHWAIWGFDLILTMIGAGLLLIMMAYERRIDVAPLASVLDWLQKPWQHKVTPPLLLGLFQGIVIFMMGALTLALSFDNRSRDIPLAVMVIPVLACCFMARAYNNNHNMALLRPEAWLGGFLIVTGILSIASEEAGNTEAYLWALLVFLTAAPLWLRVRRTILSAAAPTGLSQSKHPVTQN